ncbi:hypothetical protein PGB90_000182 [Kerria lacca]
MYITREFLSIFWNPKFWLIPGLKWEDIESKDEYDYTSYKDIYLYPIPISVGILLFRFTLER